MISIKIYYYYLFYKFHLFFERLFPNKPMNIFRTIMLMTILELWLLFAVLNYVAIISGRQSRVDLFSGTLIIPFIIILLVKWLAFLRNDQWKDHEEKFNSWSVETNAKGTIIVILITALIVVSSIISTYLYSNLSPLLALSPTSTGML